MVRKLRNLVIRRVALVEEGANPGADIVFTKRRDESAAARFLRNGREAVGYTEDEEPDLNEIVADALQAVDELEAWATNAQEKRRNRTRRKEHDMASRTLDTKIEKRSDVEAEIDTKVAKVRSVAPSLTREQATRVVLDNEPALYSRFNASADDSPPASATADAKDGTLVGVIDKVVERRAVELMKAHLDLSPAQASLKAYELEPDLENASMHYAAIRPVEDALAEIAKHDADFAARLEKIVEEAS